MRKATFIARVALAAATALTLFAMSSSAEARARGFRLRLGIGSAAATTPVRPPERPASVGAPLLLAPILMSQAGAVVAGQPDPRVSQAANGEPAAEANAVAKAPAPESAKPASRPVRVAGPWCPPDRIVGAGAGFCELN